MGMRTEFCGTITSNISFALLSVREAQALYFLNRPKACAVWGCCLPKTGGGGGVTQPVKEHKSIFYIVEFGFPGERGVVTQHKNLQALLKCCLIMGLGGGGCTKNHHAQASRDEDRRMILAEIEQTMGIDEFDDSIWCELVKVLIGV